MNTQSYQYEIYGYAVTVTADEVRAYYGKHHALTDKDIEEYAGLYYARIALYKQNTDFLHKALAKRILHEERLMKNRETESFSLKFTFNWFCRITKETVHPFKYTLNAYCLDNCQSFDRRYTTLEAALLHCLNGFNENASIRDKYETIQQYYDDKQAT
ncbi:hypothetical protein NXX53_06815 [Bacteroides salyersiae]|nr:hypothetical protein [Bacteroides salyersiae]